MVLDYYKLAEQPFGVTPDPRFLYLSETHREAIASVRHSLTSGRGFTALIAEPGMGKTTVLFNLLHQLEGATKTAFLFQSQDNPRDFLRNLLLDLGVEDDGQDLVRMHVKLNECLVQETSKGSHLVVVVDEAQNLKDPVLEVVRMLSNFETPREKLMHIILAGQPQLAAKLASPEMKQLRQRVSVVARLQPFDTADTKAYIDHRLSAAGYRAEVPLFTDRAFNLIAQYSGGIPRNINNICFNAMSLGCAIKRKTIHAAAVEEVLHDLDLKPLSAPVPVAEYNASTVSASDGSRPRRNPGTKWKFIPKGWRLRLAMTALVGFTAGIGLVVVGQNAQSPAGNQGEHAVDLGPGAASAANSNGKETADGSRAQRDGGEVQEEAAATADATKSVGPVGGLSAVDAVSSGVGGSQTGVAKPAESMVIRVGREETLYQICMRDLGRYDKAVAKMIREMNPGLGNPGRLHVGQEIHIPTPRSVSARTNVPAAELGSTLETKKP